MAATPPILVVDKVRKTYTQGLLKRRTTFSLAADLIFEAPEIVGMMGPNGSGKTTLLEIVAGSNVPDQGQILCGGQDIHRVKYRERDRLAIHYHQSYQVRSFKRTRPSFMLEPALPDYPMVHLFDEPQFNSISISCARFVSVTSSSTVALSPWRRILKPSSNTSRFAPILADF
jgi:ABC-type oligopeptide transport system ATPase subunit